MWADVDMDTERLMTEKLESSQEEERVNASYSDVLDDSIRPSYKEREGTLSSDSDD